MQGETDRLHPFLYLKNQSEGLVSSLIKNRGGQKILEKYYFCTERIAPKINLMQHF